MKTPCSECPFRRKSLKGYTGPHESAQEICDHIWKHDQFFPCHMKITQLTDDGMALEDAGGKACPCAGAAAMMNNGCKSSRDRRMRAGQDEVGKRRDVFNHPSEMSDYHDS